MRAQGATVSTPTTCPLDCPDACGILVETTPAGGFVRLRGNPGHSYSKGSLCSKTSLFGEVETSPGRLQSPLMRDASGGLRPATWKEATARIGQELRGLVGEQILALPYAGNMGQVAARFPLRVMNALNATRHDGGVCDNTSTFGYESVLGSLVGADLERIEEHDCLLLWGADVARTVQHLQPAIQRMCKRGTPVIAIDIYRTETLRRVETWGGQALVVEPGTDAALALCLARLLFERGHADREYLESECVGAARFEAHARSAHAVDWCAETCGLTSREIEGLYLELVAARRPFFKVGVGWTRRRNGAHGMRAVCALSAVLGAAEAVHYESGAHFDLDGAFLDRPDLRSRSDAPRRHVELGEELSNGDYRAVFVWGHNPVVTLPDAARVRAGLARRDTFVVVHELFLTETAEVADVVLPAASFLEQDDVYASYGHRVLQFSRASCRAPGQARGNVAAFAAIAEELGLPRELWDVSAEALARQLLDSVSDRLQPAELDALRAGHPVKLPPRVVASRGTPSGKIELVNDALELALPSYVPDAEAGTGEQDRGAFALISAPSRATHNSTYLHSSRHLAKAGRPACYLNPRDAADLGVRQGEFLQLSNQRAALTLEARLTEDVPCGSIRVDGLFRAVDVPERVGINALVSPAKSAMANASTLYSTRVDARVVADPGVAKSRRSTTDNA